MNGRGRENDSMMQASKSKVILGILNTNSFMFEGSLELRNSTKIS